MATSQTNLDVNIQGNDKLTPEFNKIQSSLIRFVGAVSSALAGLQLVAFPVNSIREFEREMANVQKTTNFTDTQIKQLSNRMIELSRRIDISATDLGKIAAAAGQMGLGPKGGVEGVAAFTDSVSRMSSVLDVTVEQAGSDVGKLVSIFRQPIGETERMISAFNEVANNSTAKGEELLDVVKRIGDAAGTINLQQAIGLGAAGIDFGFSSEVVGTSINKIFADMQAKAEKFGKFMGMQTKDWIKIVTEDGGIAAFKLYLDRLRTMTAEQRAIAIRELSGTGRIGSLVNKFANDTTNEVLDRALRFAQTGFESGTSAIKEQATVMKTLDAQTKIAVNSFKALGIEAGKAFTDGAKEGQSLTAYMNQLSQALASDRVQAFAEAVGRAMKDMLDQIVNVVKWVADLNVNWEMLITLAKGFIGLQLGKALAGAIGSGAVGMSSMVKDFQAMFAAAKNFAGAGTANELNRIAVAAKTEGQAGTAAMGEALAARQRYIEALRQQQVAQQELAASEAALTAARRSAAGAQAFQQRADRVVAPAAQAVQQAQQALVAAQNSPAVAQAQAAMQQRLERAAVEHQQRLAAIEQNYQTQRATAKTAGDEREIRRLRAVRTEEIAQEEAFYARSLTGVNSYYNRRIAIATASVEREVATRQAALAAAEANLAATQNTRGVRQAAEGVVTTSAAVASLEKQVASNTAAVAAAGTAATGAAAAYSRLGTVMTVVGTAARGLFAIASKLFFWGSLAYMVLDAVGALDLVSGALRKVGEAFGFIDKDKEAKQIISRDELRRMTEAQEKLKELIELRKTYFSTSTDQQLDQNALKLLDQRLKSESSAERDMGLKTLFDILNSTSAALPGAQDAAATIPYKREEALANLRQREQDFMQSQQKLTDLQKQFNVGPDADASRPSFVTGKARSEIAAAMREFAAAQKQLEAAQKQADKFSADSASGAQAALAGITADAAEAQKRVAGLFTSVSADLYLQYAQPITEARERVQEAFQASMIANKNVADGTEESKRKAEEAEASYTRMNNEYQAMLKTFNDQLTIMKEQPGISKETLASLQWLSIFLERGASETRAMVGALKTLAGQSISLTGELVKETPPRLGEGDAGLGRGAQEARRLARARIELRKAQLEAETKLERDANAEALKILDDRNSKGLVAVRKYFDERTRIQLADNARQIQLAQLERAAIEEESKSFENESDKVRSQASMAKLDGDIAALQQQRKFIAAENERAYVDAIQSFEDRLAQTRLEIAQSFGGDDKAVFDNALRGYVASYRVMIEQLKAEAANRPELLPAVERLEALQQLKAVETALGAISNETQTATGFIDRYGQRMQAMYDAGVISQTQYSQGLDKQRTFQMQLLTAEVQRQKVMLDGIPVAQRVGVEYQKLVATLDETQTQLEMLAAKGRDTANTINKSLTTELGNVIGQFKIGDSWSENLKAGLVNFLGGIQQMMGENIAQAFVKGANDALGAIGIGGGEGIGGFITDLLGWGNDKDTLGTATNPMYVIDTSSALEGAAGALGGGMSGILSKANSSEDPIGSLISDLTGDGGGGGIFASLKSGLSSLSDQFLSLFDGFGSGLGDIFSSLFSNLGSLFSSLFGGGGAAGGIGGLIASIFHSGGRVGSGGRTRVVSPALFAGAARYHDGGFPGLRSDEVPAILQKGEQVLTERQQQMMSATGAAGAAGGVNIKMVNTIDPNEVLSTALATPAGQQVFINTMSANREQVKSILA